MNSQHFKKKHSFYLDVILALQHIGALPASTVIPLASPGARSTTRPPRIHAHHTLITKGANRHARTSRMSYNAEPQRHLISQAIKLKHVEPIFSLSCLD
ncbi:MAG: hypothetical protein P8104_00630 [Gammaproteobacteria bacterium]